MKKPGRLFYHVLMFITAQTAWFLLLGLWIYWYVTNYLLLTEVEEIITPQIVSNTTNLVTLIVGLVLLVMLSVIMSFIFVYLNRQMNVTRLYDTFISNVTHELKSPLSSIQLYLETMNKRDVTRDKQNQFIRLMLQDVDRLNHLTTSILYLSSLDRRRFGKKVIHDFHVYDTQSLIKNVIEECRKDFNMSADLLEVNGHIDGECVIDRSWLKIVFNNLIDNAQKYTLEKPDISVNMTQNNRYFVIDITDNGIGISAKNQKKIFNKFQRLSETNSPNVKGTGLGLYWVKQIIEYHGGKISVTSSGQGKGACFTILIPIYRSSKKRYVKRLLKLSQKEKTNTENQNG